MTANHRFAAFASAMMLWLVASLWAPQSVAADKGHAQWEPEIQAFEAGDRTSPPPPNPILFVGSSSIRLWKTLADDFKGLPVINRGFGGCQMDDVTFFADRIVLPYHPKQIFVYAGDNDLAGGKAPEQVLNSFKDFVRSIHQQLPETRIAYISIKPSPSRWKLEAAMRRANALIETFARTDSRLTFIDVFTPMLGSDGQPRPEIFAPDKLHLNRQGYQLWTETVRPYLVGKRIGHQ